eukprot:2912361-Amphidinium_carterae.3
MWIRDHPVTADDKPWLAWFKQGKPVSPAPADEPTLWSYTLSRSSCVSCRLLLTHPLHSLFSAQHVCHSACAQYVSSQASNSNQI